jgi:hypothetical protein
MSANLQPPSHDAASLGAWQKPNFRPFFRIKWKARWCFMAQSLNAVYLHGVGVSYRLSAADLEWRSMQSGISAR